MLIRIAPEMFIDPKFECVTISDVVNEIYRTQKFKTRYPWRQRYRTKIRPVGGSKLNTAEFNLYYRAIRAQIENGILNTKTALYFDLSREDQKIVACALANGFRIATGDNDLIEFYLQQYSNNPDEIISPLGMINIWLEKRLVLYDEKLQTILEDWNKCREAPQPRSEIKRFEKLTGCRYLGT